jgi:TorA maturation chaperone TorD
LAVAEAPAGVAEEEVLRADLYDLLGMLLARPPSAELLGRVAALGCGRNAADGGALDQPVSALGRLARRTTPQAVRTEYDALFIGLVRGELLPYASYYLTGFLNEKPLAVLRRDMRRLGIARSPEVKDPEDHIASLCEMMAGLIRGRFGAPAALPAQRDFFAAHLAPWAGHFFGDLEGAKSAVFYAPVGAIGRAFVEIEREAFRMGV